MKTAAMILSAAMTTAYATATASPPSAEGSGILHYVRSNSDGSEPEHVVQYRPDRRSIAVYKWISKCTTAAYVTAQMDENVQEGEAFTAGKVAPDGSQSAFGTLTLDPAASSLVVDIAPPGGTRTQAQHQLRSRPFLLYDFDFADLNAFLQEAKPRRDFSFELPVIWPGEAGMFRDLGRLHADYAGDERHLGRQARRFKLRLDGPTAAIGDLWVDEREGFIIEARLGVPNHPGYEDFRLTLQRLQPGSRAAWDDLVKGHHSGCAPRA